MSRPGVTVIPQRKAAYASIVAFLAWTLSVYEGPCQTWTCYDAGAWEVVKRG